MELFDFIAIWKAIPIKEVWEQIVPPAQIFFPLCPPEVVRVSLLWDKEVTSELPQNLSCTLSRVLSHSSLPPQQTCTRSPCSPHVHSESSKYWVMFLKMLSLRCGTVKSGLCMLFPLLSLTVRSSTSQSYNTRDGATSNWTRGFKLGSK